jgi:hypothetical protein
LAVWTESKEQHSLPAIFRDSLALGAVRSCFSRLAIFQAVDGGYGSFFEVPSLNTHREVQLSRESGILAPDPNDTDLHLRTEIVGSTSLNQSFA